MKPQTSKKQLYMIGNSHIDPVWLWTWEEGMQEVKATYASVLERLKEFPDFKFTSTSILFFKWIEGIAPKMFEEIQQRVAEGRWEITGGWFIEPDCILPCGEAFVRQGLYSQRYVKSRFNKICRTGSNVDSFGQDAIIPQILSKSGMDSYVFMRPRLETSLFKWESKDGSQITAVSLPAEYTTWFQNAMEENIEKTLERTGEQDKMVCCYGVGNHGGGPTIENIKSIYKLKERYENTELKISSYSEFFNDIDKTGLPVLSGSFEHSSVGCYSIDSHFKHMNRLAERRLLEADLLMAMAQAKTNVWMKQTEKMQSLWETVLFNQFHDTICGTTIKEARNEAIMQLSGVCAEAGVIKTLAVQSIMNHADTTGAKGFPLFLFNTGFTDFDDYVEVEVSWFCRASLKVLDPSGAEVLYQRIPTEAKVRNYNIGGRRRIVFKAQIPSGGYAMYRLLCEETSITAFYSIDREDDNPYIMENDYLKVEFSKESGMINSLLAKEKNYQPLTKELSFKLWKDERDSWGGMQGGAFEDTEASFLLEAIEKVESGKLRETVRARYRVEGTVIEVFYTLEAESHELTVKIQLLMTHPWSLLRLAFPVGQGCYTVAETAYGTLERDSLDNKEHYMHRFLDVRDKEGRGLAIANSSKYSFNMDAGNLQIVVARSAMYGQGNGKDWYDSQENYRYHDLGEQDCCFVLKPHGASLQTHELYRIAEKASGATYYYLTDNVHAGEDKDTVYSMASVDKRNIRIVAIKKAEDDNNTIIRLLETQGVDTEFTLRYKGKEYCMKAGHNEIVTYKIDADLGTWEEVDLVEWRVDREC